MDTLQKINAITYAIEKNYTVVIVKEVEEKFSLPLIRFKLEDKSFEIDALYDDEDNWTYYHYVSWSLEKVAYSLCKALGVPDKEVLDGDDRSYGYFTKIGKVLEKLLIKALEESKPEDKRCNILDIAETFTAIL